MVFMPFDLSFCAVKAARSASYLVRSSDGEDGGREELYVAGIFHKRVF